MTYLTIPLNQIEVLRNERQRREVDISGLCDSIAKWGLINPIVVERNGDGKYLLIAGERRFEAHRKLALDSIHARLMSDLSERERQILELEENIKRQDLEWKDFCLAVRRIHLIYQKMDEKWTQDKTAGEVSIEPGTLSIILRVAEELIAGNKLILEAPGYRPAYNIISRHDSRKADDVFNDLMGESHATIEPASDPISIDNPTVSSPISPIRTPSPIITGDFQEWVLTYRGPPFTFLHCDFPYGIKLDKSDQGNSSQWGAYDDSEETYWKLLTCLTSNFDKLFAPSSHLMFWLSSDIGIIAKTLKFFMISAPELKFNTKLLIWHKSDGKGILADPKRGPRHVYETAIFASRGDRLIAQSVADCFSHPKGEASHQSEKPVEMLRHFFRMFISEGTSFLDPTCGLGSSLCAADSLGATTTGIELNPEWAEGARTKFTKSRLLRTA